MDLMMGIYALMALGVVIVIYYVIKLWQAKERVIFVVIGGFALGGICLIIHPALLIIGVVAVVIYALSSRSQSEQKKEEVHEMMVSQLGEAKAKELQKEIDAIVEKQLKELKL